MCVYRRDVIPESVSLQSMCLTVQRRGGASADHQLLNQSRMPVFSQTDLKHIKNEIVKLVARYIWAAVNTPGWAARVKRMCFGR